MNRYQITARIEKRNITHVVPADNLVMATIRFKAAYSLENLDVIDVKHLGVMRKPYARKQGSCLGTPVGEDFVGDKPRTIL